jgi:hypothetical protein
MFAPLNDFTTPGLPSPANNPYAQHALLLNSAIQMFNRSLNRGRVERLWCALTRRGRWLVSLNDARLQVRGSYYAGLRTVPISQICGSEGRASEFDHRFRPRQARSRERWTNVLMARYQGIGLPPVELVQIDDRYFVRDGHHRLSVAVALGQEAIDAEVTVWTVAGRLPWMQNAAEPAAWWQTANQAECQ